MPTIDDIRDALARVLPLVDVREAYVYGSYARGSQTDSSDIDLRFLCGKDIGFADLLDIQESLERILGRRLDIATAPPDQMRPSFYRRIAREEVPLYVAQPA